MRGLLSFLTRSKAPAGSDAEPRVGFLLAGVQKGGTTTLTRQLGHHPAIGLARRKEVHHFDDERLDWAGATNAAYHAAFRFEGRRRIWGECTPAYLYWQPAHDRIRAYNPAMRFVLLFRDPIERAFSQWSMEYARGSDTVDFAEAIRGGRRRVRPGRWNKAARVYSYVERGLYGRQMQHLLERFPREQVLCLPSETLFRRPEAALAEVAQFLGVPPFPRPPAEVHAKQAPAIDYPSRLTRADAALLAAEYRDDVALFASLTGVDTSGWLAVDRYPE